MFQHGLNLERCALRKLVNLLVLVSVIGALTGGSIAVGTASAQTGHVVTIADVTADEGSGNDQGTVSVTVQVDPAPELGEEIKVDFGTSAQAAQGATAKTTAPGDNTPEFPEDFAQTDGTVTFVATQTSQTVSIPVLRDNADEANETFHVVLFNARGECLLPGTCSTGASIGDSRATVTVNDDDAEPALKINDVKRDEGNGPESNTYTFTVTKTGGSASPVTVDYATADGSAAQPGDYASAAGTLPFAPSSPSELETQTVSVTVNPDTTFEPSETFKVNLSGASNATTSDAEGVGTITNDDAPPPPSMTASDATGEEGDAMNFTVTLSSPPGPGQTATADWALEGTTGEGNATEGTDYLAANGKLVFTAGETEQTVSVPTIEDVTNESAESFGLRLTKPAAPGTGGYTYNIARDLGAGTIADDDAAPSLSIDDVTVGPESGTGETKTATFTVTKSGLTDHAATVQYATEDDSATAEDYTATSGELSFEPDETTKQVTVEVKGDALDEANETFSVMLTEPVDATLADGEGVGTITDDDAASATFAIGDVKVTEGNSGTTAATLTVTKSGPTGQVATVDYVTAGGSATSGVDFDSKTGSLSFAPEETTKSITVDVKGDLLDEGSEAFLVDLSNATNAAVTDAQGRGLILDNDWAPAMAIGNSSVKELSNNSCNLTVKLSAPSGREIRVHYATANGSAGSSDYLAKSGDLTFAPGEDTKVIKVYARSDSRREKTETFSVNLSGISPSVTATFADATGTCSIIDND